MSNQWPDKITYRSFKAFVNKDSEDIYTQLYKQHEFSIQNQTIAVKNLQKICEATFELANVAGFQSMTLRQLSKQTGMSMGGLYAYINSKDDLAELIYSFLNNYCVDKLQYIGADGSRSEKNMSVFIHGHIYLSELLLPWFYFAYMETKNLSKAYKINAMKSELIMEEKLLEIINIGIDDGYYSSNLKNFNKAQITASLIKAMLQDWYLKRWKYQKRKINVDQYAKQVVEVSLSYLEHH
jgi:hypothetical protein